MAISPRVPFVFETARTDNKTADNPGGHVVSACVDNALLGTEDADGRYDYQYMKEPATKSYSKSTADAFSLEMINVPYDADLTWAIKAGSGITLPSDKSTPKITVATSATTGTDNVIQCTVKAKGDSTGKVVESATYTVT